MMEMYFFKHLERGFRRSAAIYVILRENKIYHFENYFRLD